MTACSDCTAAATRPQWGGLHASCQGCTVRALARGLPYFEAAQAGQLTPDYTAALVTALPEITPAAAHALVKAEATRIRSLQGRS